MVKRRLNVQDMARKAIWVLMLKNTAPCWAKFMTAMERPRSGIRSVSEGEVDDGK
ncbi:hypothetical protein E1B28_009399, partial [Marasmius oreades]